MENPKFIPRPDISPYMTPGFQHNPNLSTYADFKAEIESPIAHAISQYQAIAGAHNTLWLEIYKRIAKRAWEMDGIGVGSCEIPDEYAVDGLDTVFNYELIELRNRRSNETPVSGKMVGCPHHRPGIGCDLINLKGPKCLDYIDLYADEEIQERFGICLMPIKPYLDRVGQAGADQTKLGVLGFHPQVNDEFTAKTVASIDQVIAYIETFPITA